MELRCPHCRSLVGLPDAMRRYFGMPVTCHECRRSFVVPPQSPLHDAALPADSIRPLDRSLSAARCFHEHGPAANVATGSGFPAGQAICRRQPFMPLLQHGSEIGGPSGQAGALSLRSLVVGIGVGGAILWLDHQGNDRAS